MLLKQFAWLLIGPLLSLAMTGLKLAGLLLVSWWWVASPTLVAAVLAVALLIFLVRFMHIQ